MSEWASAFWKEWRERCWKRWTAVGTIIAVLVSAATLHSSGGNVLEELRFWATIGEVAQVAERTYPRAIADQIAITKSLEARLQFLRDKAMVDGLPAEQWAEIPVIESAIRDSKDKETQILKEQTYFKMRREFR